MLVAHDEGTGDKAAQGAVEEEAPEVEGVEEESFEEEGLGEEAIEEAGHEGEGPGAYDGRE